MGLPGKLWAVTSFCAVPGILLVGGCQQDDRPPPLDPNSDDDHQAGGGSSGVNENDGEGGYGGAGDGASVRYLRQWAGPEIWTTLIRTIAASSDGVVYVSDASRVFRVIDGTPEVFLTGADLLTDGTNDQVEDLAVDAEGNVHVLTEPFNTEDRIFDEQGTLIGTIDFNDYTFPGYIAAVSPDEVYVIARDGMVKHENGETYVVYDAAALGGGTISCASEAVTVDHGQAYYLPGCNGSPIYSGPVDGSGMGLLAEDDPIEDVLRESPFHAQSSGFFGFSGMAAVPTGLMVNFERALVHVDDDGTWAEVLTSPLLDQAEEMTFDFHSAPVAVDDEHVYLNAQNSIWIVETETP